MKSRDTKDFSNKYCYFSFFSFFKKISCVYSPECFPEGGRIPDHTEKIQFITTVMHQ